MFLKFVINLSIYSEGGLIKKNWRRYDVLQETKFFPEI